MAAPTAFGCTPMRHVNVVKQMSVWTWSRSGAKPTALDGRSARRLAWCEALTLLPHAGASDELFDELCCHFTQEQIVALMLAINAWSRLNVGVRTPVADATRAAQPEAA